MNSCEQLSYGTGDDHLCWCGAHGARDNKICLECPADFCLYLAENSDLARHFVQQGSIYIKCLARKTRMTTDTYQSSTGKKVLEGLKMSGQLLKACRTFCLACLRPDIILHGGNEQVIRELSFFTGRGAVFLWGGGGQNFLG